MNRVDSVSFDAKPETKKQIKDDLIAFAVDDARTKVKFILLILLIGRKSTFSYQLLNTKLKVC